jgi:flagellar protein FlaG
MTIQASNIDSSTPVARTAAVEQRAATTVQQAKVVPQPQPEPRPQPRGDLREVQAAVAARLDDFLKKSGRNVEFRVDNDAHATVITVRRADTGEVVRQYPTEDALALLRRLNEQSGTFVDLVA